MTAFVRSPDKLPDDLAANITVKVGDVMTPALVDEVVEGQDAVVILLGRGNDLSKYRTLRSICSTRSYSLIYSK